MRRLFVEYTLNLKNITLQNYKELISNQNLLPGRKILQEDLDARFAAIRQAGTATVFELKNALSTPAKLSAFAGETGLSEAYLTILRREIGSLEQKPVPLGDFPGVEVNIIGVLNQAAIKTSKDFFDFYHNSSAFGAAGSMNIPQDTVDELYALSNLVRINGVGAVAARAFYEAGYKTISDIAKAPAEEMLAKVTAVNNAKQYYKAKLGVKDMQFCIDFAGLIMGFD